MKLIEKIDLHGRYPETIWEAIWLGAVYSLPAVLGLIVVSMLIYIFIS